MTIKHVMENFANQTTMHGVPKVIHSKSMLTRIFWALICIAAGSMFCIQMSEVLHRYFSYPKKVTVEVVPTPVPFPAISVCNMRNLDFYILNMINAKFIEDHRPVNHINTSDNLFVQEYMKTVATYGALWYEYQDIYPKLFQDIFSRTSFSANIPEEILSLAAVQREEFIVNCYYGGKDCNRSEDFSRFFDPYYFNCFTYTTPDWREEAEFTSLPEGIENGWSAIVMTGSGMLDNNDDIRILPGIHEYQSAVSASEGVRVVIHPPGTEPFPFTEGYDVPPGFSASFGIRPRKNIRVGPPHGNCSELNPFGSTSARYRGLSCQKMCLQNHVIKECNCYDITLPKMPTMGVMPCRKRNIFPSSCSFNATEECLEILKRMNDRVDCARSTRDTVNRNNSLIEACLCHPPCDEVQFDVSYSLSKWPASGYEGDAAFYNVFYVEYFRDRFLNTPKYNIVSSYFSDDNRERAMKGFARLNVYIADSNVIKTQESRDYEPNQLVSDIGGQLGLWVGISVITLTEVLELIGEVCRYFCSTRMASRSKHRRTQHPIRTMNMRTANGSYKVPVQGFTYAEHPDSMEGMLTFNYPDSYTNCHSDR